MGLTYKITVHAYPASQGKNRLLEKARSTSEPSANREPKINADAHFHYYKYFF
jgi:hypothetical protein